MNRIQTLGAGYILGVFTILGCASSFPWPYYATHMPDTCYDQGILWGKEGSGGWPDLPLDTCKPDPLPTGSPSPTASPELLKCITQKVDDFYAGKAAYEKCQSDLAACQSGGPPK